jgi:signal transduction histidine kinase
VPAVVDEGKYEKKAVQLLLKIGGLGFLVLLFGSAAFFFSLYNVSISSRAQLFVKTVANDIVLNDLRSFHRKLQILIAQGDFIGGELKGPLAQIKIVDGQLVWKNQRPRKFLEYPVFDKTLVVDIDSLGDGHAMQFQFSYFPVVRDTVLLVFFITGLALLFLPLARNQINKRIAEAADQERSLAIAELAKKVAHDIRSPIQALQVLSSRLAGISSEDREFVDHINKRVKDIAEDLLVSARARSDSQAKKDGKRVEKIEELSGIFQRVIRELSCRYNLPDTAIELHWSDKQRKSELENGQQPDPNLNSSLASHRVEVHHLAEALANIIGNGIEAPLCAGKTPQVRVSVEAAQRGSKELVRILVEDNGPGFLPEVRRHFATAAAQSTKLSGCGLGGQIARGALEKMSGHLKVLSAPSSLGGASVEMTFACQSAITPAKSEGTAYLGALLTNFRSYF